jgi:hypothetical protein
VIRKQAKKSGTPAERIKALTREVERLRRDCYEAYQIVGIALMDPATPHTEDDVARVLDNLVAAANGDPRPHDDLLPGLLRAAIKADRL